ncbi:hypothetical protein SARC_15515 [Sphaeroforma arctica JP610]|uniref:Inositol-pentakisphosphate 2-kinase n=1 Tax=Sphaeroforma arctica JP610 TaxID=667725 RepID=A0A0L0F5E1_9EUKA|nr:hypothetical protein SARC_15515 [Sphaeroforma arctica JP610]KNC71940.1 hypothetical protein SARC_15515 [Sphaeroforma arctica JP610]|eukprot:XP_014145842.1 hypothetical protein SARC_15515 [Sphaeroforma arctica JP610]
MMQEDPATVLDGMWGGEDWQAARDSALQTIKNATDGTAAEITDSVWQGWSMEEKACKIREFLISTTLKDCSVMITFQRVDDANKDSPSLVTDPETGVSVQVCHVKYILV